jgi:hypothetical protein
MTYQQKITFGEMRASGVRDVLIYCRSHRCSHHGEISADRRPLISLRHIGLGFTCPRVAIGANRDFDAVCVLAGLEPARGGASLRWRG